MKILFINFNIGGFAGDTPQAQFIIKGLQELGHEVLFVVTDGEAFYFDEQKMKSYAPVRQKLLNSRNKIVEINGINVLPVHCITNKFGLYCPSAAKVARQIIKDYDIVYATNWYYHLGMVFSKIAHECNTPFVICAMASLQEKAKKTNASLQKSIADKIYTKQMVSHAAGFHSMGGTETDVYIQWGADPKKIYRIDHGLVLDNFKIKKRTRIIERIGLDKNSRYVLFVGRIDPKKGVELLLHAFSKLIKTHEDVILVLSGTGADYYVNKMKDLVNQLDVGKNVKFTGFVSEEEKLELMELTKLFILTSHSDIHPMATVEALAMSVPLILTKSCDFPEIDEYKAGILVDEKVDSVLNALLRMLGDEDILSEFSQNAKKLMMDKFLLSKNIKEYEEMFLDVIQKYKLSSRNY
jgi:glycosyltransferase involved in cell wall biosynthesis